MNNEYGKPFLKFLRNKDSLNKAHDPISQLSLQLTIKGIVWQSF